MHRNFFRFIGFATIALGALTQSIFTQSLLAQSMSTPDKPFAGLANDKEFIALHAAPVPAPQVERTGTWITMSSRGGQPARAYEVRASGKEQAVLFVFHEWWGLNDYIINEAERFHAELPGVRVLAIDLFDGSVTSNPDSAALQTQNATQERTNQIIQGAIDYVGGTEPIGTIGWCFGGRYSLEAAIAAGEQAKACVIYYGMPITNLAALKPLHAPVLGIFGTKDPRINPTVVKQFQAAMKKAGKKITVKSYDAVHAFANPSNPSHNAKATADAHKRTLTFLRSNLKVSGK